MVAFEVSLLTSEVHFGHFSGPFWSLLRCQVSKKWVRGSYAGMLSELTKSTEHPSVVHQPSCVLVACFVACGLHGRTIKPLPAVCHSVYCIKTIRSSYCILNTNIQ